MEISAKATIKLPKTKKSIQRQKKIKVKNKKKKRLINNLYGHQKCFVLFKETESNPNFGNLIREVFECSKKGLLKN